MLTTQYCYFAIKSTTMSAEAIADRLLVQPDEIVVMGSKFPEHVVPRCHIWKIVRRSTESVDEQIQHLVDRLAPVHARLVTLIENSDVSPAMQVVRYFDDDAAGELPATTPTTRRQTPPLGWNLSLPVLDFLTSTRTALDVDEYDFSEDGGEGAVFTPRSSTSA